MKHILSRIGMTALVAMVFLSCAAPPVRSPNAAFDPKLTEEEIATADKFFREVTFSSGLHHAIWILPELFRPPVVPSRLVGDKHQAYMEAIHPYTVIYVTAQDLPDELKRILSLYPKEKIRREITLIDSQAEPHKPLDESKISSAAKEALKALRPTLKALKKYEGDPVFFCFQNNGRAVVDPDKEGIFTLILSGQENEFKPPPSFLKKDDPDPAAPFDYGQWYYKRGLAYADNGRYNEAVNFFGRALEIDPQNHSAYCDRGKAFLSMGRYNIAVVDINKAIEIDPEYAEAYGQLGKIHLHQGEYDQAISAFDQAIRLGSRSPEPYSYKGWILAASPEAEYRDGPKAVELALKALEFSPKAYCFDVLAAAYAEAGRFSDAIAAQEKAIALSIKEGQANQLIENYTKRLESYQAHKPWREAARTDK